MSDSQKKGGAPKGGAAKGGPPKGGAPTRGAGPAPTKKAKGGGDAAQASAAAGEAKASPAETPRMLKRYRETVRPALVTEFGYTNPMQVPKLDKIVINMGVGEAAGDQKKLDAAVAELALISGQKPVKTLAKKAIAGFKIRKGLAIGCKVTLRKARMYEFLDRLVTIALPRVRDFRGIAGQGVRRARQLRHGAQGADHLPGDHLRQGGRDPRHGHRVRDHGEDGCRGEGAAAAFDLPFAS